MAVHTYAFCPVAAQAISKNASHSPLRKPPLRKPPIINNNRSSKATAASIAHRRSSPSSESPRLRPRSGLPLGKGLEAQLCIVIGVGCLALRPHIASLRLSLATTTEQQAEEGTSHKCHHHQDQHHQVIGTASSGRTTTKFRQKACFSAASLSTAASPATPARVVPWLLAGTSCSAQQPPSHPQAAPCPSSRDVAPMCSRTGALFPSPPGCVLRQLYRPELALSSLGPAPATPSPPGA
jgi:hypothetical protein